MNKLLTKLVYPVTGGRTIIVRDMMKILSKIPDDAEIFIYDSKNEEDIPLMESDIYFNSEENEVYIGSET